MALAQFYLLASASLVLLWVVLSVAGGADFHRRSLGCPLLTRPRWCPASALRRMRRPWHFLVLCQLAAALPLACALYPQSRPLRFLAAAVFGAYNLAESSATHSHRDYAIGYVMAAAALLPDALVEGAALGVCVHFIGSSGAAKVMVGGAAAWAEADTLGTVLEQYSRLSLQAGGPGSPSAGAWLRRRPLALRLLGGGTLLFECALVPAALLMPQSWRPLVALASLGMHVGILTVQSAVIGLAFLPNLAVYYLGFGAHGTAPPLSAGWWLAVGISALSFGIPLASPAPRRPPREHAAALEFRYRPIAEEFPLTNFALFAWSAEQWRLLFARLVEGRTRLVLVPAGLAAADLLGRTVCGKWGPGTKVSELQPGRSAAASGWEESVVYDGWEQCIGETLCFPTVLDGIRVDAMARDDWDGDCLVRVVAEWLRAGRLVRASDGRPMAAAAYVRVDLGPDGATVSDVLSGGGLESTRQATGPARRRRARSPARK